MIIEMKDTFSEVTATLTFDQTSIQVIFESKRMFVADGMKFPRGITETFC